MKNIVVLSIPSDPLYLSLLRAAIRKLGEAHALAEEAIEEVTLAVDEACSNVIKHAYKGDTSKKIIVKFGLTKDALRVTIEDNGIKADPRLIKGRDLDEVKPGGLGIHLIRKAFHVCAFDEKKKIGNRLRLVRYLA